MTNASKLWMELLTTACSAVAESGDRHSIKTLIRGPIIHKVGHAKIQESKVFKIAGKCRTVDNTYCTTFNFINTEVRIVLKYICDITIPNDSLKAAYLADKSILPIII